MQQKLNINVVPRNSGKGQSRTLRSQRMIPAIVYGPNTENHNFSISYIDAERYTHHSYDNAIFTLQSKEGKLNGIKVLLKNVERHPATHAPIHMDFYAPDMTKTVRVHVELRFIGKPIGLQSGGLFSALRRDVDIECLPTEIPDFFEVNIDNIELNQSLHISDVSIPEGIKVLTNAEETICIVNPPAAEEEAKPVVAAAPEEAPKK